MNLARTKKLNLERRDNIAGWLFVSPIVVGFLFLTVGPLVSSLFYSFTEYNIISPPEFLGWDNYRELFDGTDPTFGSAVKSTVIYVVAGTPVFVIFSLVMAMLLNAKAKCRTLFRTLVFLPSVVPVVATSVIWIWMTEPTLGVINNVLKMIGIDWNLQWFYSTGTVLPTLILLWLWTCGSTMIVFLAGLQNVPSELYEAVEVDGGGFWRKTVHVTIPMITPSIMFCTIISFINAVQCFAPVYAITNGGPSNASMLYVFYMYREAFKFFNMGKACAIAWVMFVVLLIITRLVSVTTKHWVYYEGGE